MNRYEANVENGFLNLSFDKFLSTEIVSLLKKSIKYHSDYDPIIFGYIPQPDHSVEYMDQIFRLSRMAYELMITNKISNMSEKDVEILMNLKIHSDWTKNLSYFLKGRSLSKDCKHYPIFADQAGKSVLDVVI
jgi:hypothetical protein